MGCSVWDLDGNLKHNFADDGKLRVNGLALSFDGQRLVVITESAIVVFDYATYERIAEFQLDGTKLTSVTISQDSRHMLVSISPDQIKLMEIDTGDVIQRFEAHAQKQFMIRSAFGGADENFVVSGSEGMFVLSFHAGLFANTRFQIHEYTYGAPMASLSKLSTHTPTAAPIA